MRLVFQENRFIALCNFAERMVPKAAGFFWDAEKKRWWTTDLAAAVKLRDYAEGPAKSKIGKAFITVSPWLSPLPQPPPGLALKPHQVTATAWCLGRNRAYLALRPGLGKTIVAATVARALKASVVYVCPPFLVKNVQAEFRRWAPEVLISILPDSLLGRDHAVKLDPGGTEHQLLVVDEVHRFKSPDAKRTQALFGAKNQSGITYLADRQLYMSGSPMPNRPMELYTILSHAAPETIDFMSMFDYGRKYCAGHRTDFGWDFTGASNLPELKRRVKHPTGPFMLSMGKDVLDLPPKLEEAFVIADDMSARLAKLDRGLGERYADVEDLIKARIAEKRDHSPEELHTATYRRILGQEKVPAVAKYVESILDSGQAVLLFAYHKDVIAELKKRLADYRPYVITGEVPTGERHELVEDFQKSKTRNLFIGNYQAMGVGFTLTKATRVLFAEYSWVPGENDQASDRAHRIGQGESVLVQYCIFEDSLDKAVMETLLRKRRITDYI